MAEASSNPFLFEGPEKKLVVDFVASRRHPDGLLSVTTAQWTEMLNFAHCKILSELNNEKMHSYVLSESSLFVYPFQVVLKTCGTTTLLKCIPKMLEFAAARDLAVRFVTYCRKNFMFPSKQLFPHSSFDVEVSALQEYLAASTSSPTDTPGDAYILGPVTGEHWYFYVADFTDANPAEEYKQTLEIMMTELDPQVMDLFFQKDGNPQNKTLTQHLKLDTLLGATVRTDEYSFDPCGFSLNAIHENFYYTIHVTPEHTHSYVSFETNVEFLDSFDDLVKTVVSIFRPGKFSVSIFTDQAAKAAGSHRQNLETLETSDLKYFRTHQTTQEFEADYTVTLLNFNLASRYPKRLLRSSVSSPFFPALFQSLGSAPPVPIDLATEHSQ